MDEYLGKDSTRICIAEESGVAIGFTILSKDSATSREAEFRIALNPDYLGQGFGKKLTRMLEKGFQELGLQRIYLVVRKSNPLARRLYENCGFMKTGERRKEIQGIGVDLFEMALEKETLKGGLKA
jgi:diamine N-acetyltransferase